MENFPFFLSFETKAKRNILSSFPVGLLEFNAALYSSEINNKLRNVKNLTKYFLGYLFGT